MIHSTALIETGAQIHPTAEIGPFCVIGPKVVIGARSKIHSHVVIQGSTILGEENEIFPFSVLGVSPQDLKYRGEDTRLVIGNRNKIRESVTLNLGTVQGGGVTQIGDDCLLMAYTHLGHDCIVGNRVIIANGGTLAGHVILEDHVILGGVCAVSQFIRIGAFAYIGGQSGIDRDVPPYAYAMGTRPTDLKGANIVGLKRQGLSNEVILRISDSLKIWGKETTEKETALVEIQKKYPDCDHVKKIISFIKASESGVIRSVAT